ISVARRARAATLRNSRRRPADSSRLVIYVGVRLAGNLVHTSDDDLQRLVKLPSIASGGDLPGGRRGSVNDQARLAMGAGAVCCRLLSGRPSWPSCGNQQEWFDKIPQRIWKQRAMPVHATSAAEDQISVGFVTRP